MRGKPITRFAIQLVLKDGGYSRWTSTKPLTREELATALRRILATVEGEKEEVAHV